jgi:uncharacterized protein (TIGR02757 family)
MEKPFLRGTHIRGVSSELAPRLDSLAHRYREGYLDSDPVGIVRTLAAPSEIEMCGLFAAALSLGRVATIRAKVHETLDRFDGEPARIIVSASPDEIKRRWRGFRHRFYTDRDLVVLSINAARLVRDHGSLGASWRAEAPFAEALDAFATDLSRPVPGIRAPASIPLVISPVLGSTCKRTLMYLRWMVRADDGIDFGLWRNISPSDLVIPMDVHVFRISRLLGLTRRKTASWRSAVEVTEALRAIDPADPVRFDFALSRIGIVEGCRARYVPDICGHCHLRTVCSAARRKIDESWTKRLQTAHPGPAASRPARLAMSGASQSRVGK